MKLPEIKSRNIKSQVIKNLYRISSTSKDDLSPSKEISFKEQIREVNEVKVYLKNNLNVKEIDKELINDIEKEYAEQYLKQLGIFPDNQHIQKILKFRPIKECDFLLSDEDIPLLKDSTRLTKVLHIYPRKESPINRGGKLIKGNLYIKEEKTDAPSKRMVKKFKSLYLNTEPEKENIEEEINKEAINLIKQNNKLSNDNLIFNQEKVNNIINKDNDLILDRNILLNNPTKNNITKLDLLPENIRNKYIVIPKWTFDNEEIMLNRKGKLFNIDKSAQMNKSIINNDKFHIPLTLIKDMNEDDIKELNQPVNVHIEVIIKDFNFILDNFPYEEFINIEKIQEKESITNKKENFIYKLNIKKKEDLLLVLKTINSQEVFKIVGLTLNLLYWVIFPYKIEIQIDNYTKEYIYLSILKGLSQIESKFDSSKNLYYKLFLPLFIIFIRIEADNFFKRKFHLLYKNQKFYKISFNLINNAITEIFNKHGYLNSFSVICGKSREFNEKIRKNSLPRFKNKIYATSNYLNEIFTNSNDETKLDIDKILRHDDYVKGKKIEFFSDYIEKMNDKLEKRNLEKVFKICPKITKNVIITDKDKLVSPKILEKELNKDYEQNNRYDNTFNQKIKINLSNIKVHQYISNYKDNIIPQFFTDRNTCITENIKI